MAANLNCTLLPTIIWCGVEDSFHHRRFDNQLTKGGNLSTLLHVCCWSWWQNMEGFNRCGDYNVKKLMFRVNNFGTKDKLHCHLFDQYDVCSTNLMLLIKMTMTMMVMVMTMMYVGCTTSVGLHHDHGRHPDLHSRSRRRSPSTNSTICSRECFDHRPPILHQFSRVFWSPPSGSPPIPPIPIPPYALESILIRISTGEKSIHNTATLPPKNQHTVYKPSPHVCATVPDSKIQNVILFQDQDCCVLADGNTGPFQLWAEC